MRLSIYQLKPAFQKLLNAPVQWLKHHHISPNQVTLAALLLSIVYGVLLWRFPDHKWLWAALPLVLLLRMALNAIDGLLARAAAQQSKLGALLNEISDQLADAALYLPFAYAAGMCPELVVLTVILASLTEFVGLAALSVGGTRGFAGPMGKSDRAFAFSILAIAVAVGAPAAHSNTALGIIACLMIWTVRNRVKLALLPG